MSRVKLISVFNHRYDKNIDTLKRLYKSKFSDIKFLVPFYDGEDDCVIPVKRNVSYNFQGFFWEGLEKYFDEDTEYYLFLADDAILNPNLNEHNIVEALMPKGEAAYVTGVYKLNKPYGIEWAHAAYSNLSTAYLAKNFAGFIPSYEDMLKKMQAYFGSFDEYIDQYFIENRSAVENWVKARRENVFNMTKRADNKMRYPVAMGWSDIVMVHKNILFEFARICGLFAAMHMFCEVAVPTALVYTCGPNNISTLPQLNKINGLNQKVLWDKDRERILLDNNKSLAALLNSFPEKDLLIHPVKLSQWKIDITD